MHLNLLSFSCVRIDIAITFLTFTSELAVIFYLSRQKYIIQVCFPAR